MSRQHLFGFSIAFTLACQVSLTAQSDFEVRVLDWIGRQNACKDAVEMLDGVESARFSKASGQHMVLRMKKGRTPDFETLQQTIKPVQIWSLRPAGTSIPVNDLCRCASQIRKFGALDKADADYMLQRDPRTKRRMIALGVLGQIRDFNLSGSKAPETLAYSQRFRDWLPWIGAHLELVRARGFKISYKPLTNDVEIPKVIAAAIEKIRVRQLTGGIRAASKDSKLRHMYSLKPEQMLAQRQIEATLRHHRVVLYEIIHELDATIEKLDKQTELSPDRVRYQSLRTCAQGLVTILN